MSSIWSDTKLKSFPSLNKDINVGTVIIGGGMAGILTAYRLKEKGADSVIIEAKTIGSGQTKNTTAKITGQHHLIYSKIAKHYGSLFTNQYASANEKAVKDFERIISQNSIDCDFEKKKAYLYSLENNDKLENEYNAAKGAGIDCYLTKNTSLPFDVSGALVFNHQAQFNPLKFINGILDGLTIYENTPALRIEGKTVITPKAKIKAENIIVACHYPFINFPGQYFLRMSQQRSYVTALDCGNYRLDGMYLGIDENALSLRSYNGVILLGGGAHRTGKCSSTPYNVLKTQADKLFDYPKILAKWSAQDCITLDSIPYIGKYSIGADRIYVATGFNKWGMTSSMVSADIISDIICENDNPNKTVFSPQRFSPTAISKNFFINTGDTVAGFASHLKPALKTPEGLSKGSAGEIIWNKKTAGAYRDNNGKVYIVTLRCPHLKCKLQWNSATKTWDCPCHGSRYDYKGNLIDNPAQKESILLDTI